MEEKTSLNEIIVKVNKGGPYLIKGKVKLLDRDDKEIIKEGSVALCRCGGSKNKPFCDGTHRTLNFDS